MMRAIKYRIYPISCQAAKFLQTFGCCRKIWNLMLEDKITYYRETKKTLSTTPAQYKDEYPYLREVDSLALCNVQLDLQQAFKNFFNNRKFGFPKFKAKKHSKNSYKTNNQKGSIELGKDYIKLPIVGKVKAKIHRRPKDGWVVKSATISMNSSGEFYASVLFDCNAEEPAVNADATKAIGLDYKSDGLYMDSEGNIGSEHKYFRESQEKLAKAQKKLKHKVKGSKNYQKQQQKVNKIYQHGANQRKDFLQKKSTEISNQYDVICIESLDMKAMSNKKFRNGKATMDNGWGMFTAMLDYKQEERGHVLVKIDKWFPSTQICSCCGRQQKLQLSDRTYICPCGNTIDRDLNAAINIKNEGLRQLYANQ